MSETTPVLDTAVPVPVPVPVPVLVADFSEHAMLLKFALVKIAEVDLQVGVSLDDKIKKIAEELKSDIRKADIPESVCAAAIDWYDDVLPYVIKAVDLAKSEIKMAAVTGIAEVQEVVVAEIAKVQEVVVAEIAKVQEVVVAVAIADIKKCCPSFFAKKL